MKSKHIKKETAKRLREGFHTDLIDLIEEAIDLYGEKEFERGYQSFFEDASVHAERIAELILFSMAGNDAALGRPNKIISNIKIDNLAKVIEDYFNSLKTE